MQIDIRKEKPESISEIKFWEENPSGTTPAYLLVNSERGKFEIIDLHDCVFIESKEHALNLVKAINKAISLGWVK